MCIRRYSAAYFLSVVAYSGYSLLRSPSYGSKEETYMRYMS